MGVLLKCMSWPWEVLWRDYFHAHVCSNDPFISCWIIDDKLNFSVNWYTGTRYLANEHWISKILVPYMLMLGFDQPNLASIFSPSLTFVQKGLGWIVFLGPERHFKGTQLLHILDSMFSFCLACLFKEKLPLSTIWYAWMSFLQ